VRFRQSLPLGERHLVGRLESFGDIVVGFSMSQLALQLGVPTSAQDVFAHPFRYFVFFLAFGVVSIFWIRFHRVMSTGFAPRQLDVILLFAFLAFVALTPYALVTYTRMQGDGGYSRQGVMLYISVFLGVIAFSWVLAVRGMRRAWRHLDQKERRDTWRFVVTGALAIPIFVVSLVGVGVLGTNAFGSFVLLIPLAVVVARMARRPWPPIVGPDAETPPVTLAPAEVS
jgi:uncharacterized membrane protein